MSALVLREEIAWLCGANLVAALVLNQFVFWESIGRLEVDDWQPASGAEFADELFGCVSGRTAKRALDDLSNGGVLERKGGRGSDRRQRYRLSRGARDWLSRFGHVEAPIGQTVEWNRHNDESIRHSVQSPLDNLSNDPISKRSSKSSSAAAREPDSECVIVVDFTERAAAKTVTVDRHKYADELVAMFDIYLKLELEPKMAHDALCEADTIMGDGYGAAYLMNRISDDFARRSTQYRSARAVLNMVLHDAQDTPDARRIQAQAEAKAETSSAKPETPSAKPEAPNAKPEEDSDARRQWDAALMELEALVSDHLVEKWFRPLVPIGGGECLVLLVDDEFNRDWIESNYLDLVEEAHGRPVRFVLSDQEK